MIVLSIPPTPIAGGGGGGGGGMRGGGGGCIPLTPPQDLRPCLVRQSHLEVLVRCTDPLRRRCSNDASVTVVRLGDTCSLVTDCEVHQHKVACTNSKCACSDAAYKPHSSKLACIKKSLSAIGRSCDDVLDCSGV